MATQKKSKELEITFNLIGIRPKGLVIVSAWAGSRWGWIRLCWTCLFISPSVNVCGLVVNSWLNLDFEKVWVWLSVWLG